MRLASNLWENASLHRCGQAAPLLSGAFVDLIEQINNNPGVVVSYSEPHYIFLLGKTRKRVQDGANEGEVGL